MLFENEKIQWGNINLKSISFVWQCIRNSFSLTSFSLSRYEKCVFIVIIDNLKNSMNLVSHINLPCNNIRHKLTLALISETSL